MYDQGTFLEEAIQVLRRGVPDELDWLPFGDLPPLRWRGGGAVDPRIPKGWLVEAAQQVAVLPDGMMVGRARLFDEGNAADLALWLLEAWVQHDTVTPELVEERKEELRGMAEKAASLARRFGRPGGDPEERYRQLLRQEQNRAVPSALPHRGLLSVVAACGTDSILPILEGYLQRWQEDRPEQCELLREVRDRVASSASGS